MDQYRIAIDARMLFNQNMHGIARYVLELILCLRNYKGSHKFYIFVNDTSPLLGLNWPDHIEIIEVKSRWISIKEQIEIPRLLKSFQIDVYHAPSFVAPLRCPCKLVLTIHDLNHLVLPQYYTFFHQFYYRIIVKLLIRKSEYVITVSHFSKQEIVSNFDITEDKIMVTYNGVGKRFKIDQDPMWLNYIKDLYGLPKRYIFCLANNKPHKNVINLIRAFCYSDVNIPLVLACPVNDELIEIAERFNKKHLLYFTKFIDENHLPALYYLADLFVFPSTYEGFGLPPLEAQACGVPVVVSSATSLPEIVGEENAIFMDPYDYKSIASAIEKGLNDQGLRRKIIDRGLMHVKEFSWEKMATKTLGIYEQCVRQGAKKNLSRPEAVVQKS